MAQVKKDSEKWMWIANFFKADRRADLSLTALDLGEDKGNFMHSVNSSTMY